MAFLLTFEASCLESIDRKIKFRTDLSLRNAEERKFLLIKLKDKFSRAFFSTAFYILGSWKASQELFKIIYNL